MKLKRMWINQPSALQPLHDYHGTNVLAGIERENHSNSLGTVYRIYFLSGDVVSMNAHETSLSDGWLEQKGSK